jgi:hypothetical protein
MTSTQTLFHATGRLTTPRELFSEARAFAENSLRARGSIVPTLFGASHWGKLVFCAAPFSGDASKDHFAIARSLLLLATESWHCVLVMETWTTLGSPGKLPRNPPSRSPDRIETAVFSTETGGGAAMTMLPIRRKADGAFEVFGSDIAPPGVQIMGRFTNLLPRKKRFTAGDIEVARSMLACMGVAVPDAA